MRTQRLIAYAFAAGLVTLMAGSAMAADESGYFNAFLNGKYRASASISCAPGDTPESIGSGPTPHVSFTGVFTYDGNGLFTAREHGIVITNGSPVELFEEDCIGTYAVTRNGSFSRQSTCTGTGNSYTLSNIKWKGQIGDEASVLSMNQVEPVVRKLEITGGPTFYSICGGTGTEVRISRK